MRTRALAYGTIGASISTRLYPGRLPQNPTYPAVVQNRISSVPFHGMTQDHGITESRFQLDVYGTTYAVVVGIAEEIKDAFERWTDESKSPAILDTWLDNEMDQDADEADSAESDIYRIQLDIMVHHR